ERGDEPVGDSEVLELPLRGTLPRPHPSAVISTGALDEDWFEAAWRLAPRDGEQARGTMHDILAGPPAIQVRLPGEGTDAAVRRALLEVEVDNTPARTLYRSLGFRRIGGYHYRVRTGPGSPA